jgi:hypothetical protein
VPYPSRWSVQDFAWYGWNLVNNQLYLPLTLFFLIGLITLSVGWLRTRRPDDYSPELIFGGFVGYFAITLIALNDPRYTLPCLVYVAVIGAAWIVRAPRRLGVAAAIVLFGVLAVNTAMISFGLGSTKRIAFPNAPASPIRERQLTVISPNGYFQSGPRHERVLDVMKAARRKGARLVYFAGGTDFAFFNDSGLTMFARIAGLGIPRKNDYRLLGSNDIFMIRRYIEPLDPKPCVRLEDGSGVFLVKGRFTIRPFEDYAKHLYCPVRA